MKHCLWCMNFIQLNITWTNVLLPPGTTLLCDSCQDQLEYLPTAACIRCDRPSTVEVCTDCAWWHSFYNGTDPLSKNISVFQYNEFVQELITKWKYRGDYLLGEIFSEEMKAAYAQKLSPLLPTDALVLPIPLSAERELERAFNQATQLSEALPLEQVMTMTRVHNEKQSKKSRQERLAVVNPFHLKLPIKKTVLLVDDIYTTGRTLRHAAELLTASGTPAVYALTLARG